MITLKIYGNDSRLLFRDTGSLMYEIKIEDIYEDFSSNKEMFDFRNYLSKSKYYNDSNKLAFGKWKINPLASRLKNFSDWICHMYSFLVDDNSEHKKVRSTNKNNVATISHNEYKDV